MTPVKVDCEMMAKEQKPTMMPCCRLRYPNLVSLQGQSPPATVLALAAAKMQLQGGQELIRQCNRKHLLPCSALSAGLCG